MSEIIYQRDLDDWFGDPREDSFVDDYLVVMDFSEFANDFKHVKDYEGNKWKCKIYGNYMMEDALKKALGLVVSRGLAKELKVYSGCFNIRVMKGGSSLSVHSWGLAVDFNAATNPFGHQLITDFSDKFVKCFSESGFEWGGIWGHPNFDAMHFQLPWTQDWTKSSNLLRPLPYLVN